MKEYNPDNFIWYGNAVHTVRMTLMQQDYTGHLIYEVRTNCTGADALETERLVDEAAEIIENDCDFAWVEEFFTATLHNEDGDNLPVSGMYTDLRRLIVGMEIVGVRRAGA